MQTTTSIEAALHEADLYESKLRRRGARGLFAIGIEILGKRLAKPKPPATVEPARSEADALASALQVKLTLTEDDRVVLRDTLVIQADAEQRVHDVDFDGAPRRYVLSFAFAQPKSELTIEGPKYRRRLAIDVRRSTEVESVAITKNAKLWFKLTPLA